MKASPLKQYDYLWSKTVTLAYCTSRCRPEVVTWPSDRRVATSEALIMIQIKRIYEKPADDDGCRVLVDRLWPRGVARQDAALDEWCKSIAPSGDLRKWFHEDIGGRWREFRSRYKEELREVNEELDRLAETASDSGLTLLTAAKDRERNHAVVLKVVLESK